MSLKSWSEGRIEKNLENLFVETWIIIALDSDFEVILGLRYYSEASKVV